MTLFDPREFFRQGQRLAANAVNEADYRSAISRGYYSCFLVARDQLFGIDGVGLTAGIRRQITGSQRGGTHDAVIKGLANNRLLRPQRAKRLSDQLGQLRNTRVQADYYRNPAHQRTVSIFTTYRVNNWADLAHATMTLASNLLPDLQSVPAFPP